ncbi:MAG: hypothetical protein N2506_04870 [Dehalococcoidales bacterium]|nr:hypothetical protein [Dehalococcoidales bacterium]
MDAQNENDELEAMEAQLKEVKDELREILLDIRTYLMQMQTPIHGDLMKQGQHEELRTERG